jgi:hypothetical protein
VWLQVIPQCPHGLGHNDAAKRAADNVNMHYAAVGWPAVGQWCVIALADGGSDHVLYPSKSDAVRHQSNEFLHAYVKIVPMQMGICEAQIFLEFNRKAYDNGFRMADPDHRGGGKSLIVRGRPIETVLDQMNRLQSRRK